MSQHESHHPLPELIHTLNSSEKRYVKIHLQTKKGQSKDLSVALFDAAEKSSANYDEQRIKQLLAARFSFSNFHALKSTLFVDILDALQLFHEGANVDVMLHKMLSHAELLRMKGLDESLKKQLEKASLIAEKFERFGVLSEIAHRKSLLRFESGNMQEVDTYLNIESHYELSISLCQQEITSIKMLFANILLLAKKFGGLSNSQRAEELALIQQNELLLHIETLKTFHAKIYALTIKGVVASLKKAPSESLLLRLQLHQLLTNNPHFIADKIQLHAANLYNICATYLAMNDVENGHKYFDELNEVSLQFKAQFSGSSYLLTQLRIYNLHLQLCAHTASYTHFASSIEGVEEIDRKHSNKMFEEYIMSSYLMAAMLYYLQQEYVQSLKFVNNILNMRMREVRRDITLYARFLMLALHVQMDNLTVIEYELKNLRYFLDKNFDDKNIGKRFATFFHLLLKDKNKLKERREEFLPFFEGTGGVQNIYEQMFDKVVVSVIK